MRSLAFSALLIVGAVPQEGLRPGLVASYRSLEKDGGTLVRVDTQPAFTLGFSSPHPRIAPGPFEVVWKGIFAIQDADTVAFGAFLAGEVTLTLD